MAITLDFRFAEPSVLLTEVHFFMTNIQTYLSFSNEIPKVTDFLMLRRDTPVNYQDIKRSRIDAVVQYLLYLD